MSAESLRHSEWQRRSLVGLFGLAVLAPAFGWAASKTGYAEPMENAAEAVGAASAPTTASILSGYTLPGAGPHVGTFGAALLGTTLTLGLAVGFARLLAKTE
ncbi:PDGLE domain-containing protein [Haloprofundus halobius]|uniref:PDGLE domain-containing protein n=1 Tax=Haloprofundus halobius TaxID=2876194 RepID=UPI001CCB9D08|nr:PDGLE domain-containing protein [Haloprofundus halobius]